MPSLGRREGDRVDRPSPDGGSLTLPTCCDRGFELRAPRRFPSRSRRRGVPTCETGRHGDVSTERATHQSRYGSCAAIVGSGDVMNRGIVRCGLAAILFGISAPAASRLTDDMSAFSLAGLLYLGAALAVLPFAVRTAPTRGAVRASIPFLSVAVVLGGAIGPVLFALGLGLVPAATASLLLNLELVFTTIVASLVFHEHLGRHVIAGTALVVAGSVVLTWSGSPDLRWGALLIAAACLCWAIDNSTTAAIDQISPSHITVAKGIIAGGTNLVIGVVSFGAPAMAPAMWAL